MNQNEIKPFSAFVSEEKKRVLTEEIKEIFFLSTSVKNFETPEKKQAFFEKWCGDYLVHYPQYFFLLFNDGRLLGYLSACLDSVESLKVLKVPALDVYEDRFAEFPAHLHINFHPDARGKGLGSLLVEELCSFLRNEKIVGVHLVTSPEAANVPFYKRLGFTVTDERTFKSGQLFFMGKPL